MSHTSNTRHNGHPSSTIDDTASYFGDSTVVEGPSTRRAHDAVPKGAGKTESNHFNAPLRVPKPPMSVAFGSPEVDYMAQTHPLLIPIDQDGVLSALHKLNTQLKNTHHPHIISRKNPISWIGEELTPGQLGLINHGGLPKILTKPGRYPPFPWRNWWARSYKGSKGMNDTVIDFLGLTIVQVSQNQAAVVCDPQNRIFIVKNGGFVAFAIEGGYKVLDVVDQTHLQREVRDPITKAVLGSTHETHMSSIVGSSNKSQTYVVALFLDIPANNCAILQKGDDLELVGAGQHCITNPNVTLRGIFTCGENQIEMPTKDIFTRDQVPVSLTIYLKWQLVEPLKLTTHGYNTPYEALRDKAQSILTQIVAHLDYSSMVKQRSIGPDNLDDGSDPASPFLDALRTRAMDDLLVAATEYGIVLKDLAVIDRQFKGDIAQTMDKLTTRALQAQVEAANVDRENSNKVKQEQGALQVAEVKALQTKTQADAKAYAVVAEAKAKAEALQISAAAEAEATRLAAQADADALKIKAHAGEGVTDDFARELERLRMGVAKIGAFGNRTVFVEGAGAGSSMGRDLAQGLALGRGMKEAGEA